MVAISWLSACGGGGGDPGQANAPYSVTLRAERTQLPINIAGYPVGQGVYAPYSTTLYVAGKKGNGPIPDGVKDVYSCNVAGGLDSGALYYLDGDKEHEDDDGRPLAYRSIVLGSNAGGASFHFHAGNQAGVARITCAVTNPASGQQSTASVDITVGGATGMAASIAAEAQYPVLGTQGNLGNLRTSTAINAMVLDDANQRLPASANANMQISIRPVSQAAVGARLVSGALSGNVIQVKTINGVGLFSLFSGPTSGSVLLEMVSDRFDNDVTNGIQEPVTALFVVPTVDRLDPQFDPLVITTTDISGQPVNGVPFSYVLEANGGLPPYNWAALGALPAGLTLSSSGIISGTPNMRVPGSVTFAVRVTDSVGNVALKNYTLTVQGDVQVDPLSINLSGCSADINTACPIPQARVGEAYLYAFTASGGSAAPAAWSFVNLPAWITGSAQGLLISAAGPNSSVRCGDHEFFATVTKGTLSKTQKIKVTVAAGAGGACAAP